MNDAQIDASITTIALKPMEILLLSTRVFVAIDRTIVASIFDCRLVVVTPKVLFYQYRKCELNNGVSEFLLYDNNKIRRLTQMDERKK